jgi:hypothetical protein
VHFDPRGDEGSRRVRTEDRHRMRQRARCPPRVIVAERDEGRGCEAGTDVAPGRAEVVRRSHVPNVRSVLRHGGTSAVGRRVVDDDDADVAVRGMQPRQRREQFGAAIACDHDDREELGERRRRRMRLRRGVRHDRPATRRVNGSKPR